MSIEAEGNEIVVDETDAAESTGAETPQADEAAEAEVDDVIVTIGEAPAPEAEETDDVAAPSWVAEVRKQNREVIRENRRLKQQIEAATRPAQPVVPALGPKPTMRDDDIDYVEDKYDAAILKWNEAKAKADRALVEAKSEQEKEQAAWVAKNKDFTEKAASLKAADFEDALDAVKSNIDVVRQTVLLKAASSPHLVVLALGRQPEELKKLAAIRDPIEFAVAVSKLEGQIKVSSRKPPPAERIPSPAGRAPGGSDKTREALEREAEKSGDRSKVIAHDKAKRENERQKR